MAVFLKTVRKMTTGGHITRNLVILLIMVLFFLFFQNIYIPPKQEKIEETNRRIRDLSKEVSTLHLRVDDKRMRAAREAEVLEVYRRMEDQLERAKRMLPTRENISDLLDRLTEPVKRTRVSLLSFLPFPPEDTPEMTRLSFRIQLEGRFINVGKYIQELGKMDRLIIVDNIQFSKGEGDDPKIQAQLLVSTYLLKEVQ